MTKSERNPNDECRKRCGAPTARIFHTSTPRAAGLTAKSSFRSAMFNVWSSRRGRAPSGAACLRGRGKDRHMPLLTELERRSAGRCDYKHGAPSGALTRGLGREISGAVAKCAFRISGFGILSDFGKNAEARNPKGALGNGPGYFTPKTPRQSSARSAMFIVTPPGTPPLKLRQERHVAVLPSASKTCRS